MSNEQNPDMNQSDKGNKKDSKPNKDVDHFYLDKVYPEPEKIFQHSYKSIEETFNDCLFIFDTNALLTPYAIGKDDIEEIHKILLRLREADRVFVPARALQEFAKNRNANWREIFLKIEQLIKNLNEKKASFSFNTSAVINELPEFIKLKENLSSIRKQTDESVKLLNSLKDKVANTHWDDPVLIMYRHIFDSDNIINFKESKEKLIEDLNWRIQYRIAPAYEDSHKLDGGIGDLIIWQTIKELGKERKKDIIFVTNEKKADWFTTGNQIALYPKFELLDEFRAFTGGYSFNIINFIKFLELNQAESNTINRIAESNLDILTQRLQNERRRQLLQEQFDKLNVKKYDLMHRLGDMQQDFHYGYVPSNSEVSYQKEMAQTARLYSLYEKEVQRIEEELKKLDDIDNQQE